MTAAGDHFMWPLASATATTQLRWQRLGSAVLRDGVAAFRRHLMSLASTSSSSAPWECAASRWAVPSGTARLIVQVLPIGAALDASQRSPNP